VGCGDGVGARLRADEWLAGEGYHVFTGSGASPLERTMIEHTDAPGMPDDERMTDAEFRVVREYLGLTEEWLATHLGVSSRTVHHWQEGKFAIPDGVHVAVDHLQALTGEFVEDCIERSIVQPSVLTYRTDAEYDAAHPEQSWPASWHRAAAGQIAEGVPSVTIAYAELPGA
jgi:DNA-binding transcriptional regulator YiaG